MWKNPLSGGCWWNHSHSRFIRGKLFFIFCSEPSMLTHLYEPKGKYYNTLKVKKKKINKIWIISLSFQTEEVVVDEPRGMNRYVPFTLIREKGTYGTVTVTFEVWVAWTYHCNGFMFEYVALLNIKCWNSLFPCSTFCTMCDNRLLWKICLS